MQDTESNLQQHELFETQIVMLIKIYGWPKHNFSWDEWHQLSWLTTQNWCFQLNAAPASMENESRLDCVCKWSPTLIGGQPDVLSYDAFWGMTPALLEPGCGSIPLSQWVRADLAQMLRRLVSLRLWKRGCRQPGPGSQSRAAAARWHDRPAISHRLISFSTPGQEIRKPAHALLSLTLLLHTILSRK